MFKIYVYGKKLTPGGCLPLPWGFIHVYDHNIQTSTSLKPMILKLGMKHQAIELHKVYINHDPGMTLTHFMARST